MWNFPFSVKESHWIWRLSIRSLFRNSNDAAELNFSSFPPSTQALWNNFPLIFLRIVNITGSSFLRNPSRCFCRILKALRAPLPHWWIFYFIYIYVNFTVSSINQEKADKLYHDKPLELRKSFEICVSGEVEIKDSMIWWTRFKCDMKTIFCQRTRVEKKEYFRANIFVNKKIW